MEDLEEDLEEALEEDLEEDLEEVLEELVELEDMVDSADLEVVLEGEVAVEVDLDVVEGKYAKLLYYTSNGTKFTLLTFTYARFR